MASIGQPQGIARINAANPISKNIAFAICGNSRDIISGETPANVGIVGGATANGYGQFYAANNTTQGLTFAASNLATTDLFRNAGSFVFVFTTGTINTSAAGNTLATKSFSSTFGFRIKINDTRGINLSINGSGSDINANTSGITIADNTSYVVVVTQDSGIPHAIGAIRIYVNGTNYLINSGTSSGVSGTDAVASLGVGTIGAATYAFSGTMNLALAIRRSLSDAEAKSLSVNPWQVFSSPRRTFKVFSVASGVVNYTLSATSTAYAISSKTATLGFNRKLSATSSAYAIASKTANLQLGHALSATSQAFAVASKTAIFALNRKLAAASSAYAISSKTATLTYNPGTVAVNYTLSAASNAFAISSKAATFAFNRNLSAVSSSYTVSIKTASLVLGRQMLATPATYAISSKTATLLYTVGTTPVNYTLTATSRAYSIATVNAAMLWSGASNGAGTNKRKKFQVQTEDRIIEVDSLDDVAALLKQAKAKREKVIEIKLDGLKVAKPSTKPNIDYKAIEAKLRASIQAEMDDEDDILMLLL